MRSIAVFLIAMTAFVAPAFAKPSSADVLLGSWRGKYICGQGVTALTLMIEADASSPRNAAKAPLQKSTGVVARFSFGPAPENPTVPNGSYSMRGEYYAMSRRLVLRAETWSVAPDGYFMVDLDGRLNKEGDRIAGVVPASSCTVFELVRVEQRIS